MPGGEGLAAVLVFFLVLEEEEGVVGPVGEGEDGVSSFMASSSSSEEMSMCSCWGEEREEKVLERGRGEEEEEDLV